MKPSHGLFVMYFAPDFAFFYIILNGLLISIRSSHLSSYKDSDNLFSPAFQMKHCSCRKRWTVTFTWKHAPVVNHWTARPGLSVHVPPFQTNAILLKCQTDQNGSHSCGPTEASLSLTLPIIWTFSIPSIFSVFLHTHTSLTHSFTSHYWWNKHQITPNCFISLTIMTALLLNVWITEWMCGEQALLCSFSPKHKTQQAIFGEMMEWLKWQLYCFVELLIASFGIAKAPWFQWWLKIHFKWSCCKIKRHTFAKTLDNNWFVNGSVKWHSNCTASEYIQYIWKEN